MLGGGGGHIQDMINRIKQNRSIRKSAKAKFKDHLMDESLSGIGTKMDFSHLTQKQIQEEKERIRLWARKKKMRYYFGIIIGIGLCFSVFYWFFHLVKWR